MPNDWEAGAGPGYRLWVSEDRCTLVRMWESIDTSEAGHFVVEVATRAHPSHTWGPPVTLTEEKV